MDTQRLHRLAMTGFTVTLLTLNFACGGGGGGGDDSFTSDAEIQQIADTSGVTMDPTKGTVAVETSQVTAASVRSSALIGDLTIQLYVDDSPLDLEEGTSEDGKIIVFFNVPPGDVQLKVTRGAFTLFSRDITGLAAGQTVQIRATPPATTEAQALAEQAMANLLSSTPNVAGAKADFDAALAKDGNNDLALMGSAFTSMMLLPASSDEVEATLSDLGFTEFNPNAIPTGGQFITRVTQVAAVRGGNAQDLIDSVILPAIQNALDNLDKIDSDFVQGIGGIEVDYSDVLAARASLTTTKGVIQTANAYNFDVADASTLQNPASVLETQAAPIGTVRDATRLAAARATLVNAIDLTLSFMDTLQGETDLQADDLIQKIENARDVAATKQALQDAKASLQGNSTNIRLPNDDFNGACTDTAKVDLSAVFTGGWNDLHDIEVSETDPTVGGLFPDSTDFNPVTANDCPTANVVNGQTIYSQRCDSCHGANGVGGNAPFIIDSSPGELLEAMGTGSMASLSLTLQEAADVAAYLDF